MRKPLLALLLVSLFLFSQNASTARERLREIRKLERDAISAKNWGAARTAITEARKLLNGSTRETYNLACIEALSGNKDEAFRWLKAIADSRQYIDISKDEDLASLREDPRFQQLVAGFKKNLDPVSTSTAVYDLGDPELLAEDVTYDPQTKSFFVTSVLQKTITRIDTVRNKLSLFADLSKDPGWPLLAVAADTKHRVLWVTAAAMPDFIASPKEAYGKTVLLKLDLKSGKILDRITPPDSEPRALGDMTVLRDGTVVVSDGLGGAVYRVRAGSSKLERIDANEFISPQTPALSADEHVAFVADYTRGIGRIDLGTGAISWLAHSDGVATGGVDGLYVHGQDLYGIQNGAEPERLVRFHLNSALDRIESMDVLESNSPGLGDPTHGVFVGNDFYFIANSGWSELDDNGKLKPGHQMTAASVRKISVK